MFQLFSNVSYILFTNPRACFSCLATSVTFFLQIHAHSDRSGNGFETKQIDLPIPGGILEGQKIKVREMSCTAEKINTFFNPHPTEGWEFYGIKINVLSRKYIFY